MAATQCILKCRHNLLNFKLSIMKQQTVRQSLPEWIYRRNIYGWMWEIQNTFGIFKLLSDIIIWLLCYSLGKKWDLSGKEEGNMLPGLMSFSLSAVVVWRIFSQHTMNSLALNAKVLLSLYDHSGPSSEVWQSSIHHKVASWTWQWVHWIQKASSVTRSESNRAWTFGNLVEQDRSTTTVWCYHASLDQTLWGVFPVPGWIYAMKNNQPGVATIVTSGPGVYVLQKHIRWTWRVNTAS